jgi:pyridoxal phosphate enzyme (YggS family)
MNYPHLPERVAEVRERIAAAQARSGREGRPMTIVAVTKTHPPAAAREALAAGITDLAENRVQELEEKVAALEGAAATWHLIGHLQRNKVRRALPLFDLLHSLDSVRLAQAVSEAAAAGERIVRALVQVNVSGEGAKGGFSPVEAVDAVGRMAELPGLELRGMMTMAPFVDDEGILRGTFAAARTLMEDVARQVPSFQPLHLSMGMSSDYEIAVEEGSTLVRLGTVLFGARET